MKGRSKSSKSIVFLSDIHVGSQFAVSSRYEHNDDEYLPLRKALRHGWYCVRDELIQKRPTVLVINGETINGAAEWGEENWTNDYYEQAHDALRLLKGYKPKSIMMTRGSNWHVQVKGTNIEKFIADQLNAVPYSPFGDAYRFNTRVANFLFLSCNGWIISVTHHIRVASAAFYKTTPMAREMVAAELNIKKLLPKKYHDFPYIVVRSHVHDFKEIRYHKSIGFTTPAWKFADWYLLRKSMMESIAQIGSVELIIESNGQVAIYPHILSDDRFPRAEVFEI